MNAREREGVGRLLEAVTILRSPRETAQGILDAFGTLFDWVSGEFIDQSALPTHENYGLATYGLEGHQEEIIKGLCTYAVGTPIHDHLLAHRGPVFDYELDVGKAWFESELYRKVLRKFDMNGSYELLLRDETGAVRWTLAGAVREKRFTRAQRALFETLHPHVERGVRNLMGWSAARAGDELLNAASEALVALQGGRIVAVSGGAAALLQLRERGEQRNLHLREFIRIAHIAAGQPGGECVWQSPGNGDCRVNAVIQPQTGALLVRIAPAAPARVPAGLQAAARARGLTARQAEVLELLSKGMGNAEIGRLLGISYDTARAHVREIFKRLNVSNRIEAVNAVCL